MSEQLRELVRKWREIAAATWPGFANDASNVNKSSANAYLHCAKDLAALLTQQPKGDGVPLKVFSGGTWTYDETGQCFASSELDEAAFVAYRDAQQPQAVEGAVAVDHCEFTASRKQRQYRVTIWTDQEIPHGTILYTRPARLAALGDDTKRLDWLEGVGTVQIAQWYRTGARKFVEIVDQDEQQISEGTTLRAAIDAAMHQEPDEDD